MTPDQHAQVKELFLQAREMSTENRANFLRQQCSDDTIRVEVTSLLNHDSTATILTQPAMPAEVTPVIVGPQRGRLLSRMERAARQVLQQLFGRPASRLVVVLLVLVALLSLAVWTYTGMRRASQSIAASELQTILNADVKALELWIEEKRKDVKLWSSRIELREAVSELVQIAESESEPAEALRAAPALADLRALLDEFDRIVDRPEQDSVLSRDGLALASNRDEHIGTNLNTEGIAALVPVFQGRTLFLEPHPNGAFGIGVIPDLNDPMLHVVAPVYGVDSDSNKIVAAAGFGFPADDEFTAILQVARQGETGETYTFDGNGLMLSESRFDPELRDSGLLPDEPTARSIFRIEIRDPGPKPYTSPENSIEAAERPLTTLAARAIAAGRKGGQSDPSGVILEPYSNYRGAKVIGAWRWLSAYGFGVATEVEVNEQYAPLRYPLVAAWIRFGLLALCVVSLLAAASWIVILERDVEQARRLGQYTLQERIGQGGMGIVYRAQHELLQRPTAIKLLRAESVDGVSLARFEREVQLASSLTHPNTIDIFDFGRTPEGSFYCVMEFLQGRTLEEVVRSEGPLAADRVIHLLNQIAGSLNEAHQRGLVHRDIKPSNIMVCEQGGIPDFVKVLDFGLAREVEPTEGSDVTLTALVVGTPMYLAPERITDPTTVDRRSDLYSLGAVGYYLLTDRNLYDAPSASALLLQIPTEDPRPPSQVTTNEIPQPLENLIMRCLARRPDNRPTDMQQVVDELATIQAVVD
jgi:tRNA A-37 threonylcarbamoyl transferase component Bud32